jgi:lipooligosaccharide transport system permease protein
LPFRAAIAIWQRDIIVFWRDIVWEMVTVLTSPLTFLLAFGFGLGGYVRDIQGVPYVVFVVPGLISMTAVFAAFEDSAWGLWYHRTEAKTIQEYLVNPITPYDVVIGKIFSGTTKAFIKSVVVGLVLWLFARFPVSIPNLLLYGMFVLLGLLIFSCVGTIFGTLVDKPEQLGRFQVVVITPLIFLAGLFFPLSAYPPSILHYVELVPTTAIFEGARLALLNATVEPRFLLNCVVSAVIFFIAAVIVFDRKVTD